MAPLSPFFSDELFRDLNQVTRRFTVQSVHHSDFPTADPLKIDLALEERMQLAQDSASLILSLRKKENIIVRQPLEKVLIPVLDDKMQEQLSKVEDLIKSETNIKEVTYLKDDQGIIHKKIKADFKSLGKRLGAKMKQVASLIGQFSSQEIARLEKEGKLAVTVDGEMIEIQKTDVIITAEDVPGWSVASRGQLTVALDITITEALKQEGIARIFVNRIQNIRKEERFELTDRIFVEVLDNSKIKAALQRYNDYICSEILADRLSYVSDVKNGTEIDIDDNKLKIKVQKNS
jgi:isoleucyl-tRNA synthetase